MKLTIDSLNREIEEIIAMKGNPYQDFARMIPALSLPSPVCQRSRKLNQKSQQNFFYGILQYDMFTNRNKSHLNQPGAKNKSRKLDLALTQNIHTSSTILWLLPTILSVNSHMGVFSFSLSLKCLISTLLTWTCNVTNLPANSPCPQLLLPCSLQSTAYLPPAHPRNKPLIAKFYHVILS